MEENNMWKENFEKLNSSDQMRILQGSFDLVSQKINNEINAGVRTGNLELIDIAYNKMSNGKIVFDATIIDKTTGLESHEFYDDELDKIDLDKDKINSLKIIGMDTLELEKDIEEIEGLKDNPENISLANLKELDRQVNETASSLGLSKEQITYSATVDSNAELKIKADSLGGSQYDRINADEKVSTHYNIGEIIGGDYKAFQIIKTSENTYRLMGIDENGFVEEINDDRVEFLHGVNAVSLMQENGETVDAPVLCAFRIKSASDIDREQVIGLCDNGSTDKATFYGRGAISTEQMIAISVPNRTYSEDRVNQKQIMDTLETPSEENMDVIRKVAEQYEIDPNDLLNEVRKEFPDFENASKEDIERCAKDIAEYMAREQDHLHPERTIGPENPNV